MVGNDSILLRTTDGGDTWNSTFISAAAEVTGESEDLLSIVFQDAQNGWITGDDNVLLATTDGGATWTNQRIILSDRGHDINDITVLGNGHIIAVADLSQTIRSEDSGASWTVSDRTTDLFYIGNIEGIDSYTDVDTSTDFAVAVAVNGGILH